MAEMGLPACPDYQVISTIFETSNVIAGLKGDRGGTCSTCAPGAKGEKGNAGYPGKSCLKGLDMLVSTESVRRVQLSDDCSNIVILLHPKHRSNLLNNFIPLKLFPASIVVVARGEHS